MLPLQQSVDLQNLILLSMQSFHFPIMIIASIIIFVVVIRITLPLDSLKTNKKTGLGLLTGGSAGNVVWKIWSQSWLTLVDLLPGSYVDECNVAPACFENEQEANHRLFVTQLFISAFYSRFFLIFLWLEGIHAFLGYPINQFIIMSRYKIPGGLF
ncbi:MAG: hypothetical protein IPP72_17600 [Chitinophagaceae bacterium]|nr:hypothetical protein [Chitinophagaceae bacterium]